MRQLFTILILGVGLSHAQTMTQYTCVTPVGKGCNKWVKLTTPQGPAGTIAIGTVTTLPAGSQATVKNEGTPENAVLDFAIPVGNPGDAATIKIGTVTTGESDSLAWVKNSGSENAAVFDFSIPKGKDGIPGTAATIAVGKVLTLPAGTPASVVNVGSDSTAVFDMGIPQGPSGDSSFKCTPNATGSMDCTLQGTLRLCSNATCSPMLVCSPGLNNLVCKVQP